MSDLEEEEFPGPSKRRRLDNDANRPQQLDQSAGAAGDAARVSSELELGNRLREVMLCTVCLDLPNPDENFQCTLGHILCEDCTTRLMAQAAIRRLDALCPQCRTPISWNKMTQNLAVGQTLWELPKECPDCEQQMDNKSLANHLKNDCCKRLVNCQYRCLGCTLQGYHENIAEHEAHCKCPTLPPDAILNALKALELQELAEQAMCLCYKHMSAQRIFYEDLELCWPQTATRYNSEWKFDSSAITAFENTWGVCCILRTNAHTEVDNYLSYSLKLMTTPHEPLRVKYFVTLPAQFVRKKQLLDVQLQLKENEFVAAGQKSEFWELQMRCPQAFYRLLAMPCIKLRIWMLLN